MREGNLASGFGDSHRGLVCVPLFRLVVKGNIRETFMYIFVMDLEKIRNLNPRLDLNIS